MTLSEVKPNSVLITGFQPFHGHRQNSSQVIGQALADQMRLDFLLLPVSYKRAWDNLRQKLEVSQYNFVFMLGQGGGRSKLGIEKVAVNLEDCDAADEDGFLKSEEIIYSEGPSAIINPQPLRALVNDLKAYFGPVDLSSSCGTFVCNSTYYKALYWAHSEDQKNKNIRVLFTHVPYLPEQVMGRCTVSPFLVQTLQVEILRALLSKWAFSQ